MRIWKQLITLAILGHVLPLAAGSARNGQGNMTVIPTVVEAGSATNYVFRFRTSRNAFNPGAQVTILVPLEWSIPQTHDASLPGYVRVTPVLDSSTAALTSISGTGPWLLTIDFSTSQNQAGFVVEYLGAVAPRKGGLYRFTSQSRQSGGVLRPLRSGSPSVAVNSVAKINTTTMLSASKSPSIYGETVTFTAAVSAEVPGPLSGTLTFRAGDMVLATVPLDGGAQASFSTNRFSVADSPEWITAEYSGDAVYNGTGSAVWLQEVRPAGVMVRDLGILPKPYDGTANATLDLSRAALEAVLAGDPVFVDATAATALFRDPSAGMEKAVTVDGVNLSGEQSSNYELASIPTLEGDILPAALRVRATDASKTYGSPNPSFSASYTGFVNGEDVRVLKGSPTFTTSADANSSVEGGPYVIEVHQGTLSAANYSFVFEPGLLAVLPAPSQAPRLFSVLSLASGVSVQGRGTPGEWYVLQTAAEPNGSWSSMQTNRADAQGLLEFVDPGTAAPRRFYRLAAP